MPIHSASRAYNSAIPKWTRCRDVIAGQDAVKAKRMQYLPVLEGHASHEDPAYLAYLLRAEFYNATGRTVQGFAGAVFRRPPLVEKTPTDVEDHLKDVTRNGHELITFATQVFNENLSVGRVGLLVEMPPAYEGAAPEDARPYWVTYKAEQIINYHCDVYAGKRRVTRVILKEEHEVPDPRDPYITTCETRYRELLLENGAYVQRVHEKAVNQTGDFLVTEEIRPTRLGKALDFIPFVFMNTTSIEPEIEEPALLDLVDVNLSHYRSSADYEHGAHFTALPTPWVVGAPPQTSLKIGAGTAWILNESPFSKAEMLEYSGQGLGAIEKIVDRKEKRMAVLGARLLESQATQQDTATAVRLRQTGDESILKRLANAVSAGLTRALRYHVWWTTSAKLDDTTVQEARIALNTDFIETHLAGPELTALVGAYQSAAISFDTLFFNLEKGELIPRAARSKRKRTPSTARKRSGWRCRPTRCCSRRRRRSSGHPWSPGNRPRKRAASRRRSSDGLLLRRSRTRRRVGGAWTWPRWSRSASSSAGCTSITSAHSPARSSGCCGTWTDGRRARVHDVRTVPARAVLRRLCAGRAADDRARRRPREHHHPRA